MVAKVRPDIIHPAEVIISEMKRQRISRRELADRMQRVIHWIKTLLSGHVPIDTDIAVDLQRALGLRAGFWIELQLAYNQRLREAGR